MKKVPNSFAVWIIGMAMVGIMAAGLFLFGFPGRSDMGRLSRYINRHEQVKGKSEYKPVRSSRNSGRVSSVDDGDRFPDLGNLDREPPLQSDVLQRMEGAGRKGLAVALLLKEAISAGHGRAVSVISGQLVALGNEAVPDVMLLLNSGDKMVEAAAFSILSRIGTEKALAALIGKTLSTTDSQYRAELERQFANIQTPVVTDMLLRLMNNSDQPVLKAYISSMLSSLEGGYIVNVLADAIIHAKNREEAMGMMSILANLNKPSNIPGLEGLLSSPGYPVVWESASIALANIGNAQACDVLVKYSSDWLASVNSPYGQQALLDILESNNDSDIRLSAAVALGNYNSSDLKSQLEALVVSEADQAVKAAINNSISAIDGRVQAVPADPVPTGDMSAKQVVCEHSK